MTVSAIVYTTINENYPAAGQDNDSQGFRDNFARIKTALGTAQSEITYLNNNAVDKTTNNDMLNNTLSNVILQNSGIISDTVSSNAGASPVITFADKQYKKYAISQETTFQIDNWPVGCYSSMYLELRASTGTKRIRFRTGVINNSLGSPTQYIHLGSAFGSNNYYDITAANGSGAIQTYLFKVSSPDGGINTYVELVDMYTRQA